MIAKEIMRNIEGVGIFPIISLVLFFVMFTLIIVHTITIKKEEADALGSLPFNNTNNDSDE
ncbi:MAG: CcoQ/FixQ family Cbb3-type cytochrome c oxidase assembly chaperone [Bacteroidia bacterium]